MTPRVGDRAFALDLGTVLYVSAAICLWADQLVLMSALVPTAMALRTLAWSRLDRAERGGDTWGIELALLAACTGLGAFNDYNSVVRHGIYDYAVPVWVPEWTTIPLWMLLFWGMILRFLVTLFQWHRLGPGEPDDRVWLAPRPSPRLKVGLLLALVLVTRQTIYRLYLDPVLSWLPFAAALLVYVLVFRPDPRRRRLMVLSLVVGPLVEALYIQVGGLHRYHLGLLGGVPIWIALWWVLAIATWEDLSLRLLRWFRATRLAGVPRGEGAFIAAGSAPARRP